MGFHLADAIYYNLDKELTTMTEQAVLVALAFRASDGDLRCFPKYKTLEQMTHMHHSTVASALNALREKCLLEWEQGGVANGDGSFVKSNKYRFMLPEKVMEAYRQSMEGDKTGKSRVAQNDTASRPERHVRVAQNDTDESPTATLTEEEHSFENSERTYLESVSEFLKNEKEIDRDAVRAVGYLMQAAEIEEGTDKYKQNYKTFYNLAKELGYEVTKDMVSEFNRQNHYGVKNLAAKLMIYSKDWKEVAENRRNQNTRAKQIIEKSKEKGAAKPPEKPKPAEEEPDPEANAEVNDFMDKVAVVVAKKEPPKLMDNPHMRENPIYLALDACGIVSNADPRYKDAFVSMQKLMMKTNATDPEEKQRIIDFIRQFRQEAQDGKYKGQDNLPEIFEQKMREAKLIVR